GGRRRAFHRRPGDWLAGFAGILDRAPGRHLSGDSGRSEQHGARSHRHELASTTPARRAHLFPGLQCRPRGPLRQVLGAGGAKLTPDGPSAVCECEVLACAHTHMWRRSSSIRTAGARSYWCRARYSVIWSAAVRGPPCIPVSMISRQSGRLRSTMARGCETCVTGMFMAHLRAAHRAAAVGLLEEAPVPTAPRRATMPPPCALSPWRRAESF